MIRAVLTILIFFTPLFAWAQSDNLGVVQGLWYGDTPVFAGDSVRIYAAVHNHSGSELSGTVTFYVDDEILTQKSINALNNRLVESWADWQPTYGEHTVRVELSQLALTTTDGKREVTTIQTPLARDVLFVDTDTDGDGVGDKEDTDDDGDGISDSEEERNGTDPKRYNAARAETDEPESEVAGAATSTTANVGLEQYMSQSEAASLLRNITDWTNERKQDLDAYRQERDTRLAIEKGDPDLPVDESGFGEVVRSEKQKPAAEKPEGFFGDLFTLLENIVSGIITALLAILSWLLSYPALVQILLLFGLLFVFYKIAKKFGSRGN